MMGASRLPILASASTLGNVMSGASFRVPGFQRAYAWKEEQVEELWEDLTGEAMRGEDPGSYHFFGTLLMADSGESPSPQGSRLEILDGQQRLATFALLLVAVDRELEEIEDSQETTPRVRRLAQETRERIREVIYLPAPPGIRRIELRPEEDALFNNILHGNPPGHSRLGDAFRFLHSSVRAFCEGSHDRARDLQALVRSILDRSMVIHARCVHGFDPFAVFSTLNARGLPLTAAQILRARSLGLVADMGQATEGATRASWDKIEALGEEGDRFLQYYLIMREGSRIQAKSVVREFDRKVLRVLKKGNRPAERFADLAVQLDELAEVYGQVRQGLWPSEASSVSEWRKRRLRLLTRELGVKQALPLMMSIGYRAPEALEEAVDIIERAAFVALMCFPNQTRWGDFLFERAKRVFDADADLDALRRDIRQFFIQQLGNPERALAENLPIQLRFNGRKKTLVRYFLTTLNDYGFPNGGTMPTKPDEQAEWNLGKIQIEHISPRGLSDGIPPDEKDRLGNLTPLYGPTNASLGMQTFSEKKRGYKDSPLRMTRSLVDLDRWNALAIQERENDMIRFAGNLYCRDMTI